MDSNVPVIVVKSPFETMEVLGEDVLQFDGTDGSSTVLRCIHTPYKSNKSRTRVQAIFISSGGTITTRDRFHRGKFFRTSDDAVEYGVISGIL